VAVIFPRWSNYIPLGLAAGAPIVLVVAVCAAWYWFSPRFTDVGYQPRQPVPFSHARHAGALGMDCRYCHDTVERAAHAAVPPTKTCMNCHVLVLPDSPRLALVRQSWQTGEPLPWTRVHMLPDYARFDHSVHLAAGVGCASCHGRIDQMQVVKQVEPLSMGWCLSCHRNPWPQLRPPDQVTNMAWDAATSGYDARTDPARTREPAPPLHCSGCHQ